MPMRARKQCGQRGCPNTTDGSYCAEHSRRLEERGTAAARGYDYRWRKHRAAFLREHPLCERCKALGVVKAATEPHHRVPRREGGSDDWSNLEALCHECHSKETRAHSHARMAGGG